MPRDAETWVRAVVLFLGLSLGVFLRVDGVGLAGLFGDEYHTVPIVAKAYGELIRTFDAVGSHVPLPVIQKLCLAAFGDGVVSFRLIAIVPGILALLALFPIARVLVGPTPAVLATLAFAVNPMQVYYSRFARSYSLLVLLGLLLAYLVLRASRSDTRRGLAWSGVTLCAVLLPYVHLSSVGFVAALAVAAVLLVKREGRSLRPVLIAFGAAAVILALLYLPLREQVSTFRAAISGDSTARPLGWFGTPTLLAGGRMAAVAWLGGLPLGAILLWRVRPEALLICAAAVLGPLALLLATLPHGMDYAYARYLLCAQPFALAILGWLLCEALRRIVPGEVAAGYVALGLGVVLVVLAHFSGPLGPGRQGTGAFDNTYLAMHALPAFDAPYPAPSPIFARIAQDDGARRIVVTPPLQSRAVLMFRSLARLHGKEVAIGWGEPPAPLRGGPYADLAQLGPEAGDYLVLHRDLRAEVRRYWRHLYVDVWPGMQNGWDESFMERQKTTFMAGQPLTDPKVAARLAANFHRQLGAPFYEDEQVLVWKLRP